MDEIYVEVFVLGLKIWCVIAGVILPPLIRFGIVAMLFDW